MGKNLRRYILFTVAALLFIVLAVYLISNKNSNSLTTKEDFQVETVERGDVLLSVKASGIIESDDEIIIRSPERSIIRKVYKNAGSHVTKGELLIELDEKSVQQEIERMKNQLELKQNSLNKTQLNAQSTQLNLDRNEEAKKLRISSLKTTLEQQEKMLSEGTITQSRVDRTKQEIEMAETDLQTQIERNNIRIQQMDADQRGLLLQIHNQEKNLKEKEALLNDLRITAPADGVILAINTNEGQRIESGAMMLRMSDLSSFKVVGWINERYAPLVQTGNQAVVFWNDEKLLGLVGEITPMIEDEMIHFDVHLSDKKHSGMEVNQSISLEVTSRYHENVLRIKKHPQLVNTSNNKLYVLRNREAIKTEVIFGTIGNDYCEIVSGINEGDRVLIGILDTENGLDSFKVKNSQIK